MADCQLPWNTLWSPDCLSWVIIGWKDKLLTYLKQCLCFLSYGSLTLTVTNTSTHFIYIDIWWNTFCTSLISAFCFLVFKHAHVSRVLCSTYFSAFMREFQIPLHFHWNINPCNWLKTNFFFFFLHSGIVYFIQLATQRLLLLHISIQHNTFLIITENSVSPPGSHEQRTDKELVEWLQLQGADTRTIEKVSWEPNHS